MSFWRRMLGKDEPKAEPDPEPIEAEPAPEPPADDADSRLAAMAEDGEVFDDDQALLLIEELRERGRDARAIDLARRLLANHPDRVRVHLRIAELLAARGDDEGAAKLIARFVDGEAPLELWMLAAEIAERRGDEIRALALYERVVARDFDFPRARARVARLREGRGRSSDIGATLMADGALTRGRYRVERELGRGGAGTVFLADDLSLDRKIALKVYHRRGRVERARLLVEARVPARFEHPGIIRIFDLEESLAAIAMERVVGGSVRSELGKGAVPLARVLRWIGTAAEAVAVVHAAGLVHRDLKPSNFLLRDDDRVVLTDFGVTCAIKESGGPEGTLGYMPPEQRAGAPAAASMDMFALGASMREVLSQTSGHPPALLLEIIAACSRADASARPTAGWLARAIAELAAQNPLKKSQI